MNQVKYVCISQDIFIQKFSQRDLYISQIVTISALVTIRLGFLFFVSIIFCSSLIDFAFAQNDTDSQSDLIKTISELDDLLSAQVTATMTVLSLTGATFLVRTFTDKEDEIKRRTNQAQKDFIKAFFMFLISTIVIFVFDFFEILIEDPSLAEVILDLVITYGFFGIAIVYLIKSAGAIRKIYGK